MDRKTEQQQHQPQTPSKHNNNVNPVPLFKDISNFKTPKRPSLYPNFANLPSPAPTFFTASKNTPGPLSSFRRSRRAPPKSSAARKLKAFELEQSQSSRKVQIKKEHSVRILSKSLTVWLNFLLENPELCGCSGSSDGGMRGNAGCVGKRGGGPEGMWREVKRQRGALWSGVVGDSVSFPNSRYSVLRKSLSEICSFDDLVQRTRAYLSLEGCREVFDVMTQVVKNIDEGRLKMKVSCPVVTDFGMKEKALGILLSYNTIWLRIGLYIILGGDSLLDDVDANSEQEIAFLKMVIEKQFFTHMGIAKAYVYNKKVEGLYRPGYYEALGSIILKRFLLLVLILDRAKSHSSLPLKHGIDGLDGGSPLLFTATANIKSSRQVIHDFLSSDAMHGEGNLLAHLVIVGYKVSYQQGPLLEYDFRVTDLFQDLRDGVRLCRAIQLLQHDSSILMKIIVPSDTCKKNQANCVTALQYLRQAGVPLHDDDGVMIEGEDVANGDKELVVSMLWNMFVHLQLPQLIDKTTLADEISRICGGSVGLLNSVGSSDLDTLLSWIKAICENYEYKIENLSSLCDGKAIWCILDYYFRKELHCSASKDQFEINGEESIMSATDYTDAVHNFLMSQKLTTLLGNFPEVLQISDILEHKGACNYQSVVILLVFLASQLIIKKNMELLNFHKLLGCSCQSSERRHLNSGRSVIAGALTNQEDAAHKFKDIQAWWQNMAEQNNKFAPKPSTLLQCPSTFKHVGVKREHISLSEGKNTQVLETRAAVAIQTAWKKFVVSRSLCNQQLAAIKIQSHLRGWLFKRKYIYQKQAAITIQHTLRVLRLRNIFLGYINATRSAIIIQSFVRRWIVQRGVCRLMSSIVVIQKHCRSWKMRRDFLSQREAAITLQSTIRCLIYRDSFLCQRHAAVEIQRCIRKQISQHGNSYTNAANPCSNSHTSADCFQSCEPKLLSFVLKLQRRWRRVLSHRMRTKAVIVIQAHIRGWIVRQKAARKKHHIVLIQKHCRSWKMRRDFLSQREAAITLQSIIRCLMYRDAFLCQRHAAVEIQHCIRKQISQHGNSYTTAANPCSNSHSSVDCFQSCEPKFFFVLKLQRWWRRVLSHRMRTKAVVLIQAHIRGWIGRQKAARKKHHIVLIQSHWKGYIERKYSRVQLLDLRLRMQESAANVDDSKRLINRLLVAVAELLSMRSISGILHTCATLDMATKHSQRCCEELVAAGAVATLLKLIHSVSRSIPDQEVLKYSLSTLRNLARYPHLAEVLIDTNGSVEAILWQFLRSKEEGYFIASELLKRICKRKKGMETLQRSPAYLKRIYSLVDELTRKANIEKRNARGLAGREQTDNHKRLREATELWRLLNSSKS